MNALLLQQAPSRKPGARWLSLALLLTGCWVPLLPAQPASTNDAGALNPERRARLAAAGLPADAIEPLEKQVKAMEKISLEYTERWLDPDIAYGGRQTNKLAPYLEPNRFYSRVLSMGWYDSKMVVIENEVAFEGDLLFVGEVTPGAGTWGNILSKHSVSDLTEPARTKRKWSFAYLEAASFYAPERISELDGFRGVEPLVLHYLEQSTSTSIERAGENWRVTVRVPDRLLVAAQKMDLERRRKELERPRTTLRKQIERELKMYERLRQMVPERKVMFTLSPRFGYAALEREEWAAAGQRIVRVVADDFREYPQAGIWLPNRCDVLYFNSAMDYEQFFDQPGRTNSIVLESVKFGPRTVLFALDRKDTYRKPGTLIIDRAAPEARERANHQVTYTVGANGTLLRHMAQSVSSEMRQGKFWIFLLVVVTAPLLVLFIVRKGSSSSS